MDKFTFAAAAAHLVTAYKELIPLYRGFAGNPDILVVPAPGAPSTYLDLRAAVEAGCLPVSNSFCDTAIYGRDGNITFRTLHDLGHYWCGEDFSVGGEVRLATHMWPVIASRIPKEWVETCHRLYLIDTVEQSVYAALHDGQFPADQKAFAFARLREAW
jgi:hypothetical protein